MINYARSGGTILSKCLGSLDNIIFISEVNPYGYAKYSIHEQSKNWYNIHLNQKDYLNAVLELHDICISQKKQLILRDWTFLDFTPCIQNNFSPTYQLNHWEILKNRVDVIPFCFIRDSIDIWISRWMPPEFFLHYNKYIKTIISNNLPTFKYEDFCRDSDYWMKSLCSTLNLTYSEKYKNYIHYQNVTGDNTVPIISRGNKQQVIQPLKRKRIPNSQIKQINNNSFMKEANELVYYPKCYEDVEIENRGILLEEIKYRIKNLLSIPPKDIY
jgi:hypothetical protein